MAGWHHRLDRHEFGWTPGVGDGQGGLACCDSWDCKESDTTERLNQTELNVVLFIYLFIFLYGYCLCYLNKHTHNSIYLKIMKFLLQFFFVCVRFIFLPFIVIFFPPGINYLIYCEVVGKTDFIFLTCITSWAMTITKEKNYSFLISLQDKLHYIKSVYVFEPVHGFLFFYINLFFYT